MANHKSAIKRHKQSLQRAARNRAMRSRMKNAVKEVRAAVLAKDTDRAAQALTAAQSVIGKAAGKGTVHWKNAARKVSRLSKAVAGVAAQALLA